MTVVRLTLCCMILLWLAGCASSPGGTYGDGSPAAGADIDLSSIPPAIPKNEPPSRYGNPDSYTVFGKTYYPVDSANGYVQIGKASWYGRKFHGRRTSSGETYDMYRMTAAHKTLPLPSYVRVTNLRNDKHVIVRVNDRGPFHGDRIIDLSYVAALKLGMVDTGTAPVLVEAVTAGDSSNSTYAAVQQSGHGANNVRSLPAMAPLIPAAYAPVERSAAGAASGLFLQVGAFANQVNARQLDRRLQGMGIGNTHITTVVDNGMTLYRVRVGPFASSNKRRTVRRSLSRHDIAAITVSQAAVR